MIDVVVREYARLTTAQVSASLDQHTVSESAFEYLCSLAARTAPGGAKLVQMEDRVSLRLDNYVGVIQTPCGTRVEIVPKHVDHAGDAAWSRVLLKKMLLSALRLPTRDVGYATIELLNSPLSEWVMQQFLRELDRLVKRGLRFEYRRVHDEQRFLRGRLDVYRQLRQPAGKGHLFQIEHDIFVPDRPENRLLKSALDRVCRVAQSPENWRLAHELAVMLAEVPSSSQIAADFERWRDDRLMAHYSLVRPWCELVLGEYMPTALRGVSPGISLLFPMQKLFEQYVADRLSRALLPDAMLEQQVAWKHLCEHDGRGFFRLQPDLLVRHGGSLWVLDTKWKMISSFLDDSLSAYRASYGLSQADFYQLFAYGHQYLGGQGDLMLIYPRSKSFIRALPPFSFSNGLTLWVVPFDLDRDALDAAGAELPLTTAPAWGATTGFPVRNLAVEN